jgi:dihydrofolate reductase
MGLVISDMSISLDGYVTGPNDSREHPFGEGAESLHDWLFGAATDRDRELLAESTQTGAIVMGRWSYDKNEGDGGWGDTGPLGNVPCFVLTHQAPPPDRVAAPDVFTFVTDGVESLIARAKAAAGDLNVGVHGATVAQQCLRAGLLDEIQVHVVPILLGGGTPLFGHLDARPIELERTGVVETPAATHLRFRVVK